MPKARSAREWTLPSRVSSVSPNVAVTGRKAGLEPLKVQRQGRCVADQQSCGLVDLIRPAKVSCEAVA